MSDRWFHHDFIGDSDPAEGFTPTYIGPQPGRLFDRRRLLFGPVEDPRERATREEGYITEGGVDPGWSVSAPGQLFMREHPQFYPYVPADGAIERATPVPRSPGHVLSTEVFCIAERGAQEC
jgi:hypothetical protein